MENKSLVCQQIEDKKLQKINERSELRNEKSSAILIEGETLSTVHGARKTNKLKGFYEGGKKTDFRKTNTNLGEQLKKQALEKAQKA